MQLWFRVTEGRAYARAVQRLSPWITPRALASLEERVALQEWVVVEQWEHDTRKPQPAGPIIVLVPRATPWDLGSYHWGAPTAPWDAHFGKPGREGNLRITLAPPTLAHPPGTAHLPGGIEPTRPLRRSGVGALANQPRRVDPLRPDTPHRAGTLRFHYIGLMLVDATFAVSGFLLSLSGAGSLNQRRSC